MKLELKLKDVSAVINFLDDLSLKGLKGINRTKLTRHLVSVLQEESENEKALRKELSNDREKLDEEIKEFYNQTVIVEGGKFLKPLEVVKAKIREITSEESNYELKGIDSVAAFVLYEAFNLEEGDE